MSIPNLEHHIHGDHDTMPDREEFKYRHKKIRQATRKSASFAEAFLSFVALPILYDLDELESQINSFKVEAEQEICELCDAVLVFIALEREERARE